MRRDGVKTPLWIYGLAVAASLGIAWLDSGASEVQPAVALLLVTTFALGAIQPRRAWRWALLVGLGIPVLHFASLLAERPSPPGMTHPLAAFVPLVPAFLGAYVGALAGRVFAAGPPAL